MATLAQQQRAELVTMIARAKRCNPSNDFWDYWETHQKQCYQLIDYIDGSIDHTKNCALATKAWPNFNY